MQFHSAIKLFGLTLILLTSFCAATAYASSVECIETAYNTADCQSTDPTPPEQGQSIDKKIMIKYWGGVILLTILTISHYLKKLGPNATSKEIKWHKEMTSLLPWLWGIFLLTPFLLAFIRSFE